MRSTYATALLCTLLAAVPGSAVDAGDLAFSTGFKETYPQIMEEFELLTVFNSAFMQQQHLGVTPGGRDLDIFSFGNQQAAYRALFICNHHGDETWVAQLCLDFGRYLVWAHRNDHDDVRGLLAKVAIDILPIGNPDGFAIGRRYTASNVNINRNFPFQWRYEEEGTRNDGPGPVPLSEFETASLYDYQLAIPGDWALIVNYHLSQPHSGALNYILLPWSYTRLELISEEQRAVFDPYLPLPGEAPLFEVETSSEAFFPYGGGHTDWAFAEFGVPAITMELGHGYDLPTHTEYLSRHLPENMVVFKRFLFGLATLPGPPMLEYPDPSSDEPLPPFTWQERAKALAFDNN